MTEDLEISLQRLEAESEHAGPGAAAHVLSRAGDLCLGAGQRARALAYYGRAIDACLGARRYNAAAGLCRKLLRVAPGAVRTRCTLAWLALGRGEIEETRREVGGYVEAATGEEQRRLAALHLHMMAETTRVPEIRRMLAGHLETLGRVGVADDIRATVADNAMPPALSAHEQELLWRAVVEAATLNPDELPT